MSATIVVIAVLALLIFFAVRSLIRTKKSGGCSGCPGGGDCEHCHIKKDP